MSELTYQPGAILIRAGSRLPTSMRDDAAAVVQAYYDAVRTKGLAADVLEAASDPSNPMHEYFTWDDMEAADRERMREVFELGRCFLDGRTGEPIFVSTYRETNNAADAGRIHINVRLLPPAEQPVTEARRVYQIGTRADQPVYYQQQPTLIDIPPEVVEDPSLDVFKRWVDSHKHQPMVLRAAWRILRDAL